MRPPSSPAAWRWCPACTSTASSTRATSPRRVRAAINRQSHPLPGRTATHPLRVIGGEGGDGGRRLREWLAEWLHGALAENVAKYAPAERVVAVPVPAGCAVMFNNCMLHRSVSCWWRRWWSIATATIAVEFAMLSHRRRPSSSSRLKWVWLCGVGCAPHVHRDVWHTRRPAGWLAGYRAPTPARAPAAPW
jgi:hypothetical protein